MLGKILAVLALTITLVQVAYATLEEPVILVFHEEGCPDCRRMEAVLQELLASYPELSVARYEITQPGSSELFNSLADRYGVLVYKVPIIYVGEVAIVGAGRVQVMRLREAVEGCALSGCISPLRFSESGARLPPHVLFHTWGVGDLPFGPSCVGTGIEAAQREKRIVQIS